MFINGYEIPPDIVKKIEERYVADSYIVVMEKGDNLFLGYEREFENLDIVYKGFYVLKTHKNLSGFASIRKFAKDFTYLDKKEAVKHYLGIVIDEEREIEKWFDKLLWLRDNTSPEGEVIDELIF